MATAAEAEADASSAPAVIVDAYTHYAPKALAQYLQECSAKPLVFAKLFDRIPLLTDVAQRVAFLDACSVQAHVLVPLPWLETVPEVHGDKERALEACRRANVETAEVVAAHPGRFVGVALLPTGHMEDTEVIMGAYRHAVHDCGLDGVALFVGPLATPPDHPGFDPLYAACERDGVPIWVHPNRPQFYPDYEAYRGPKGGGSLHQIWNTLGWVYDTSVAMVHMALARLFRRHPDLKVVTHHHGGMVPFFTERFTTQSQNFDDTEGLGLLEDLKKFYCDTATFGLAPLNIRQALEFFEEGRVLFGTDTPMDMADPGGFHSTSLRGLKECGAPEAQRRAALSANFEEMMAKRYALKKKKEENGGEKRENGEEGNGQADAKRPRTGDE